jgi:hypothetical protein
MDGRRVPRALLVAGLCVAAGLPAVAPRWAALALVWGVIQRVSAALKPNA